MTGWSFLAPGDSNVSAVHEKEIKYIEVKVPIKEELQGNFLQYIEVHNIAEIETTLEECEQRKMAASQIIQAALKCGYDEEHSVILLAQKEWDAAHKVYTKYKDLYDKHRRKEQFLEYPVATEVWEYLKNNLGYSDIVSAAIIGNMMAEVGGGTLDLIWDLGTEFYGLCQWHYKYYPEAQGKDIQGQLEVLKNTIEYEFNWAGEKYQENFKYKDFIEMTDVREAALAFAMSYERCAAKYFYIRCDYAEIAYDYFTK